MTYHSHALEGFEGLARHPVRWVGVHLAVYASAALAAAAAFAIGAAVYSYIWAGAGIEAPADPPTIPAPVMSPKSFPAPAPSSVNRGDLVAGIAGQPVPARVNTVVFSAMDVTGFVIDSKAFLIADTPSGKAEVYSVFVPHEWPMMGSAAAAAQRQGTTRVPPEFLDAPLSHSGGVIRTLPMPYPER